ncbi:Kinase [Entamoeba marina]
MNLPYIQKYLIINDSKQVGGHSGDIIFQEKQIKKKIGYQTEIEFYEENKEVEELKGIIPKYYGHTEQRNEQKNEQFIYIENIIEGYEYPCVLDIKMGNKTWYDGIKEERKKERIELDKRTTQNLLGFRFCGMKITSPTQTISINKKIHLDVHTKTDFMSLIHMFLEYSGPFRHSIVTTYIQQLNKIKDILQQLHYRFFSTSILFVYNVSTGEHDIRLIDFSHYFNMKTKISKVEDGFEFGIKNLEEIFKEVNSEKF